MCFHYTSIKIIKLQLFRKVEIAIDPQNTHCIMEKMNM